MIPITKETKCRWCGKRIYWIHSERGRIPIEAGWTPYKRNPGAGQALYRADGGVIPCEILTPNREAEAEGYAHIYHYCAKKPIYHRPRPLTRREKYKSLFE